MKKTVRQATQSSHSYKVLFYIKSYGGNLGRFSDVPNTLGTKFLPQASLVPASQFTQIV
ncbi:MAG: hypothetical protein H6577_17505 [Lewinellaceae bacterium]|nr:hypothetical protein [Saprospiraceae bacterium]MCB9339924.1 hypothetical protein [Lewinellaceae bacterium]